MGHLNGRQNTKKLMMKLSCGHTLIVSAREAPLGGYFIECKKCPIFSDRRRIMEKQWVNQKEND